jgi:DNA-binding response OmpR family regulator
MAIGTAFHPSSYQPSQSRTPGKSNGPEAKVLIVGEEAAARRALHVTLYDLGFDVGEATGREEATALCRLVDYGAVLLDVNVMGGSDIETLVELRCLRPQGAIFILGVEGDPERKVEKAGRRIHVTPLEFDLLRFLMTHPGLPVPRGRLLQVLWGDGSLNRTDCLRTMVCQAPEEARG